MKLLKYLSCVTLVVGFCRTADAERAPERREAADYVVTGTAERVFHRREGRRTEYLVQMRVERAVVRPGRGRDEAFGPGDTLYAYCFQVAKAAVPIPEEAGHHAVPKEGQLVTAYLRRRNGRLEGNYPDWFEAAAQSRADGAAVANGAVAKERRTAESKKRPDARLGVDE